MHQLFYCDEAQLTQRSRKNVQLPLPPFALKIAIQRPLQTPLAHLDFLKNVAAPLLGTQRDFAQFKRPVALQPLYRAEYRSHHRIIVYSGIEFEHIVELENVEAIFCRGRRLYLDKSLAINILGDKDQYSIATATS